ncbi:MAG: glycerol-3-phosphate 1-O-acyltransferase PlsY [Candidatus Gastranaerophilales bacterium]|nr:glycerol-3-phosphate 1-O-acyltransferase PlsY [Candidatus Gastranaerophilales bacterium]
MFYITIIVMALLAYLIGSIPTGYLIVKAKTGTDIRTVGSGSTGATNVKRVLGKGWFFTVMVLDAIKGAFPVILARIFFNDHYGIIAVVSAVFVIIGHSKPIFLQFKGGKSVASGVGTLIALNSIVGISIAVIWAIITYISKYVSLGSIIAIAISPILMYYLKNPIGYTIYCLIAAIYIIYLHRQNIQRLIKGEENKVR